MTLHLTGPPFRFFATPQPLQAARQVNAVVRGPEWEACLNTAEWRKCSDPRSMLPYLEGEVPPRKARLLAVALCRRVAFLMADGPSKHLLAEAERFGLFQDGSTPPNPGYLLRMLDGAEQCAEGLLPPEELAAAGEVADALSRVLGYYYACYDDSWGSIDYSLLATCEGAGAVYQATRERLVLGEVAACAGRAVYRAGGGEDDWELDPKESVAQCDVIRELFVRPPRAAKIEARAPSSTVLALAKAIYEAGAFDQMPILADALEDAGCDDSDFLGHLRSSDPHCRGCWALDLVLAKS
jgi:hypothetical protein